MVPVHSLLWLARWFNGEEDRLFRLQDLHLLELEHYIYQKYCGRRLVEEKISLYGIEIVVSYSSDGGTTIHAIGPPRDFTGLQLAMFQGKSIPKPKRQSSVWWRMMKGANHATSSARAAREAPGPGHRKARL